MKLLEEKILKRKSTEMAYVWAERSHFQIAVPWRLSTQVNYSFLPVWTTWAQRCHNIVTTMLGAGVCSGHRYGFWSHII